MLSATATETLRSAETTQTWFPNATNCFLFVVLRHTNCQSTWRQYYNRSPTNPDVNYNPPRTSRYRFGYTTLTILSPPFNTTKSTHSTTTLTVKALTNSLREVEENGKLPFLGCLVSRDDNSLRTTVYRKPIYTDRLMDESSYNPTSHRATAIRTLTRRSQLVCNTTDSLSDEKNYFHRVFQRTITTRTSFNVTLTDLLLLPRITTTQILRLQQLYCT